MAIGSGLGAQLMLAEETTVGTAVTVTKTLEFVDESLAFKPTWLDSEGLKSGVTVARDERTTQSRFTVEGDITLEAYNVGLGLLIKHALGSAVTIPADLGGTGAYAQRHRLGDLTGRGLTVQVGRPQPDGTVRAHTYRGCKVVSWEFSVSDGELARWKFTLDGWDESTATSLATAAYTDGVFPFSFADASISRATTATVGTDFDELSGSVTALTTLVKGITIKGETPLATERYGLGNDGIKKEQIQNGFTTVTVELDAEYTSATEFYSVFKLGTTRAYGVTLERSTPVLGDGTYPWRLEFILPACKIKEDAPNVSGPDLVGQKIVLQAYDPEISSLTALTVHVVSDEFSL